MHLGTMLSISQTMLIASDAVCEWLANLCYEYLTERIVFVELYQGGESSSNACSDSCLTDPI